MIKIKKFKGSRLNVITTKNYIVLITVEKEGVERTMFVPVFGTSSADAAKAGRAWRNVPGNMERLEKAFDDGLCSVESNRGVK